MASTSATSTTVGPSTDVLGFGKHGEKTYQEAWDAEPGYCIWTMNKFKELVQLGDELATPYASGESKMKRFAQWLIKTEEALEAQGPLMEYNDDMELVAKAGSETLAQRAGKIQAGNAEKFYAVACPTPAVYKSWAECKPHVVGVKGVMYKSFPTLEEAEAYKNNPPARAIKASKKPQEDQAAEGGADVAEPKKKAKKSTKNDVGPSEAAHAEAEGQDSKPTRKGKAAKAVNPADNNNAEPSPQKTTPAKQAGKRKAGQGAGENDADVTPTKPAKATRKEKVVSVVDATNEKSSEGNASHLSDDVLKKADELGMSGALKNLMSRNEIMILGLSGEKVLDALVQAEGLVNKAKNALVSADPSTPVKSSVVATPEKPESSKGSSAGADEAGQEKTLSAMQKGRIELNRELALARKAQKV